MTALLVAGAAAAGLIAGAYARALAARFTADPGDPRREARDAFAAAVRARPVPRPPYLLEIATAAAAALAAWRVEPGWQLAAWGYAVWAGAALAAIDWRTRRLPDAITLPSYPVLIALLAPSGRLPGAALAAAVLIVVFGVLWLIRPADLGLGDVKLSGLIGLVTGSGGPAAAATAVLAGVLLAALYAIALLARGRGSRDTVFPFGPFLITGALAALAAGSPG
ncbi:hypothetical protein TBS_12110 [Thermobispora bispora]|uniref:Peptidase A24A prepilin type IV n=1 Tax=Thermobispora bispora (strain ATCC 19993 / DSM 43833 / CBS 139.67 / JCM 10125 / KCTC 9307 / NBRC 14880 / R51) TaxID=469371 RepID=D6Y346_THEBD|nr:A24 family peptidase [Thermobispora bispora]ADG88921.1 peptidase A24A prepilin type IV [Thermobispora bispora DSM 43833]MBO2473489.1 prepilin peptidase [Actinomycetales bacterium]MDI9579893.1 A24 family peptidase [Thermobispora sp.]QSI48665.1 prepilin peptidase [Thermobispora bispora]